MDSTLIILLLIIVILAIVAVPRFFQRKNDPDDLAPPLPASAAPAAKPPRIATASEIDTKPFTRWLCDQASKQTGIDLRNDPLALTRLTEAAAKAQSELENAAKTEINLPYISADARGPQHFKITVTREQLGNLPSRLV